MCRLLRKWYHKYDRKWKLANASTNEHKGMPAERGDATHRGWGRPVVCMSRGFGQQRQSVPAREIVGKKCHRSQPVRSAVVGALGQCQ